jgi:uncharacterized protein (DUF1778 family)
MAIKITSTREAVKVQASQRSKQVLGKKVLELGKEYALLFPKKGNEVVVSGIVGRNTNYDALAISFGRIMENQMDINEETGRIKDKSGMDRWAALSSILYKASEAKEIKEKEEEAKSLAEKTGSSIDERALEQAIEKVREAYNGKKKQGDEKEVLPTKQRLVGSRVDFSIFTEALLIPLNKELKPEFEKAVGVEVKLSIAKQRQINAILDNPVYHDVNDPDGFLEIKFSYIGKDTKEAGQNKYQGVEPAVRKVNLEKDADGKYKDTGVESITHLLNDVSHDSELMFNRAGTVSFANTSADVEAAMRKFLANNRMLPLYIDFEDEMTIRHAKDIIELGCVFKPDTRQYKELLAIVEEQKDAIDKLEDDSITGDIAEVAKSKSTKEVVDKVDSNEELKNMVEDEVEDI